MHGGRIRGMLAEVAGPERHCHRQRRPAAMAATMRQIKAGLSGYSPLQPRGCPTCDGEGCIALKASMELHTGSECMRRRLHSRSSGDSRRYVARGANLHPSRGRGGIRPWAEWLHAGNSHWILATGIQV